MNLHLEEVTTAQHAKDFINIALKIYKGDPNWIRPLDKDINDVFNPGKNKAFKQGVCKRWLLKNGNEVIGRIAAFVNKKYKMEQPTGGVGFFECIDNQEAANFMLDH